MKRTHLIVFWFPLCLLFLSFSPLMAQGADTKGAKTKLEETGAATCRDCHEKEYESYAKSVHSRSTVKSPGLQNACETCHGSGAAHVEKGGGRGVDIFAFNKEVDAKARSAKCLICHEETRQLTNWNMSKHNNGDMACDDCHSPHRQKGKLLKEEQSILCFKCHLDIRSQTTRQSHHPLKEGLIQCTSCHDPHGTFGDKQIKADTVNELCYKCHSEKRGPFMFEHSPVAENCLNCHTSHGSNHSKLLISKPPLLCQSCHDADDHSSAPYTSATTFRGPTPSNKMFARACLNCHSNIHGSNASATLGQRFLR